MKNFALTITAVITLSATSTEAFAQRGERGRRIAGGILQAIGQGLQTPTNSPNAQRQQRAGQILQGIGSAIGQTYRPQGQINSPGQNFGPMPPPQYPGMNFGPAPMPQPQYPGHNYVPMPQPQFPGQNHGSNYHPTPMPQPFGSPPQVGQTPGSQFGGVQEFQVFVPGQGTLNYQRNQFGQRATVHTPQGSLHVQQHNNGFGHGVMNVNGQTGYFTYQR